AVSLKPKSFSEAISFLYGQFLDAYETVNGQLDDASELENDGDAFEAIATGLYSVPGAVKNYLAQGFSEDNLFIGFYLRTTDADKAFAKYNELCKSIQSASVTLTNGTSVKLEGEIAKPDRLGSHTVSKFYLPGYD